MNDFFDTIVPNRRLRKGAAQCMHALPIQYAILAHLADNVIHQHAGTKTQPHGQ
jgi:hypothetical protein